MDRDSQQICRGSSSVFSIQQYRRWCGAGIYPPGIAGMRTKGCSPRTPRNLVCLGDVEDGRRKWAAIVFLQFPGLFVSLLAVDERQNFDTVLAATNLAA